MSRFSAACDCCILGELHPQHYMMLWAVSGYFWSLTWVPALPPSGKGLARHVDTQDAQKQCSHTFSLSPCGCWSLLSALLSCCHWGAVPVWSWCTRPALAPLAYCWALDLRCPISLGAGWAEWLRGFVLFLWLCSGLKGASPAKLAACFKLVKSTR